MAAPTECPTCRTRLVSPHVLHGTTRPCDCVNANGHRHGTYQCRECKTVVYDPPCPKWEAEKAVSRRIVADIQARIRPT